MGVVSTTSVTVVMLMSLSLNLELSKTARMASLKAVIAFGSDRKVSLEVPSILCVTGIEYAYNVDFVGNTVGSADGNVDGWSDGWEVGIAEVGCDDGCAEGSTDGVIVGEREGVLLG